MQITPCPNIQGGSGRSSAQVGKVGTRVALLVGWLADRSAGLPGVLSSLRIYTFLPAPLNID